MILRQLVERWEPKVQEKHKELEEYINQINKIKKGFEDIRIATGLESHEAIVKSLIKSQDSMTALQKHINILVDQIDELESEIKGIDERQADVDR